MRMRNVSYEQAAMLLGSPAIDTVEQIFGTDPVLGAAILRAVIKVNRLAQWLATARNPAQNNPPNRQVSDAASKVLWQAKPGNKLNKRERRIGPWDGGPLPWLLANLGETTIHKKWRPRPWCELIGKEKVIVAAISTLSNDPGAVIELCEWLLDMAASGVFASGWYDQLNDMMEPKTPEWQQNSWEYFGYRKYHALTRLKDADSDRPDLSMDKQLFYG